MNTLNIQQGSNLVEQVTPLIINKLYEVALSVSEPLEGELDNAYLSGYLLVGRASLNKVKYLAGTVLLRGAGNEHNNSTGRFDDLKINVTDEYYIDFEDSEVEKALLNGGFSSDGAGVTISDAANAIFTITSPFYNNQDITSFNEFNYFTKANTEPRDGYTKGGGLFKNCHNLKSINLSLCTAFGTHEFYGSGVETINAPLLTTVKGGCFMLSGVKTVENLGSISSISKEMFSNCTSLTSVNLPTSVTNIGNMAFLRCGLLSMPLSDISNVISIENEAFSRCSSLTGELYLPNLTTLGQSAFSWCTGITKVTCLGKISSIENSTFYKDTANSTLTEVYLPYECTSVETKAFFRNSGLTTIKLYTDSVDNWSTDPLTGEKIPGSYGDISRVTYIGNNAFLYCTSLLLPVSILSGVTYIGERAFADGPTISGTTLSLPNLTLIGDLAFYTAMPNLTTISDLGSITELPNGCFRGSTNITSVTLPNTLTTLLGNNFQGSHIKNLIYPEGITDALLGLTYIHWDELLYVEIPTTCTNMDTFFHRSLDGTSTGTRVVVIKAETPPTLSYYRDSMDYTNLGINKYEYIYVPDNSLADYRSATGAWQASAFSTKLRGISNLQTDFPAFYDIYNDTNNQYHNGILT